MWSACALVYVLPGCRPEAVRAAEHLERSEHGTVARLHNYAELAIPELSEISSFGELARHNRGLGINSWPSYRYAEGESRNFQ
jgi:hypothetical protein